MPSRIGGKSSRPSKLAGPANLVRFDRSIPPVHRVPAALARRFDQICISTLAEALAGEDLTPLEFAALRYVGEEPGLDQSDLCERIGIDRNSASLLITRLESKGFIDRRLNGQDRRARILYVTPAGKQLHDRALPRVAAGRRRMLSVLNPEERETLLDLLVRLIEGNRLLARPGAGRRKREPPTAPSNKQRRDTP